MNLPPSHPPSQPLGHQSTGRSACVTEQRPTSYFTRGSSPGSSVVKNPLASSGDARDTGSIPGSGRSPPVVNGKLLQFSCLKNSMDRGAWQATAQKVEKCRTRLSGCVHTHAVYVCQGCCLNHSILYSKSGAQGRSKWNMGKEETAVNKHASFFCCVSSRSSSIISSAPVAFLISVPATSVPPIGPLHWRLPLPGMLPTLPPPHPTSFSPLGLCGPPSYCLRQITLLPTAFLSWSSCSMFFQGCLHIGNPLAHFFL